LRARTPRALSEPRSKPASGSCGGRNLLALPHTTRRCSALQMTLLHAMTRGRDGHQSTQAAMAARCTCPAVRTRPDPAAHPPCQVTGRQARRARPWQRAARCGARGGPGSCRRCPLRYRRRRRNRPRHPSRRRCRRRDRRCRGHRWAPCARARPPCCGARWCRLGRAGAAGESRRGQRSGFPCLPCWACQPRGCHRALPALLAAAEATGMLATRPAASGRPCRWGPRPRRTTRLLRWLPPCP